MFITLTDCDTNLKIYLNSKNICGIFEARKSLKIGSHITMNGSLSDIMVKETPNEILSLIPLEPEDR